MKTNLSGEQTGSRPGTTSNVVRYLLREAMGLVMLAVVLFVPAGHLDWPMGWALVGIVFLWVSATGVILILRSPELIAERVGPRKGAKTWDTVIMSIVGLTTIARCIVAGLDERFGWTTGIFLPLQLSAMTVAAMGYALVVWSTASNAFFSQIVRIQEERGHSVASSGPYRFVRHPGYVGTILFELATPVMLGSCWALVPGGLGALLFIVRTALEDRTLLEELDGYQEYAQKVRYRLLPGVW
ncbi:MAG TPA: isoprenylcysteine carboxylmethyltransferase family protein [Anaerolineae bacterium]|nr:isoprenylcysteine carboxylmethyltransferase family protein [Anaerolineae bacterium]